MIETGELAIRLGTAAASGALVGFEREAQGQPAGIRTHALVAIGSCIFTIVGAYGFPELVRGENVDPMRVAAQIVSGIGFVGAGAMIRDRGSIRGITTAAALWASAALGMAAGAGLFGAAGLGLVAILFALVGLRTLRDRGIRHLTKTHHSISATYHRGHGTLSPLIAAVEAGGGQLQSLRIDDDEEEEMRRVELEVRTRDADTLRRRVGALADLPEVDTISCP
jgi:putative Mg2+ transporter-C (MgtC) family protein